MCARVQINSENQRNNADERTARLLAAKAASGKSWDEIALGLGLQVQFLHFMLPAILSAV